MGDRVRALGATLPRDEHRESLAIYEELAEKLLEDEAEGASYEARVNVRAVAVPGKTNQKTRWIPRGAGKLITDGAIVVPMLIAEIRRRDDLLRRVTSGTADPQFVEEIRSFLGET